MRRRSLVVACAVLLLGAACSTPPPPPDGTAEGGWTLEVTTPDIFVNAPQRLELVVNDEVDAGSRTLVFGTVHLAFSFLGSDGTAVPDARGGATAHYLALPGTPSTGTGPVLSDPSSARGAYLAEGVSFNAVGLWEVLATTDVGGAPLSIGTTFRVAGAASLPAVGDRAIAVDNPTIQSAVPAGQIDSRASDSVAVPDPNLHRWSVRAALATHRPILLLFSTPTYCQSQVCGPATDQLAALAKTYADRAIFIHVEVWKNFDAGTLSPAASAWLLRDGIVNEPWLYLIGANGTILDRWPPLMFDWAQLAGEVAALPASP